MRSYNWQVGAVLVGLAVGLGSAIPLASRQAWGQEKLPTIPVSEVKEGMKGYGLTVFKGTVPEKFDVEVINVLHNFRPGQDLIVAKTMHPRLSITKNVKGMSGSPIFLGEPGRERLAGAYAYSFSSFVVEPVAGVTPIDLMITEMRRPIRPGFWPLEGQSPLPGAAPRAPQPPHASLDRFDGAPGSYDLVAHAKQMADRVGARPDPTRQLAPASTPLLMSGVSDRTAQAMKAIFEPLGLDPLQAGGGGNAPGGPEHFANGGGLGVELAKGDVSFMGLGTATYVEGTKVAGFGHPMMNGGDSAMPTCIARVLWVWASDQHSFKIGECARSKGALVQDRQSAIVVDETKTAPMFPVDVKVIGVDGAPKKTWHVDVLDDKFMSNALTATVLGSVVEATVSERRDVTWQLHSKVTIRNHGTIELDDFGVATGGTPEAPEWFHSKVIRAVGDVLNNPWEQTHIDHVEATMKVEYARDVWRLRGVDLLDPIVDVGEKVRIKLRLLPFAGPEVVRTVEVALPADLAGKDVDLEILPGYEVGPDVAAPESLTELLANEVRQHYEPKSIVVQYKTTSQGVSYRGHVAPRLPAFALDAMRATSTDAGPESFNSYTRTFHPVDRYVEGRDKVRVKVRPIVR